jgi:nitrogen-specific signal transduction histidine kinase
MTLNCVPRVEADGTVSETVTTLHDVTMLRNTIARASQHERLAMAGALAAGVGHEINNPLTYIIGNLDFSLEELRAIGGPSPSSRLKDLATLLREAREGAERIRKIVLGLRTLSREDVALQPVEVGNAIEMALNMGAHELRNKALVIVNRSDDLPRALADESRLTQVLVNLLVNAAQAFERADPEHNRITIATRFRPPDHVVITVSDNGPGVPPNLRGRIFDPFFTTKPVGEGTGLGLSVSRNIMDSMGGGVALEHRDGSGATFELVLPVASEPESTEGSMVHVRSAAPRGRIAVIDDEPAVANVIQRILSQEHEVVTFDDPRTALEVLTQGDTFDVVFCDMMMPHISGEELFRRVCARRPELAAKFVFITGALTTSSVQTFLSCIPNDRLDKPFAAESLLGIARRFVAVRPRAPD